MKLRLESKCKRRKAREGRKSDIVSEREKHVVLEGEGNNADQRRADRFGR